MTVNQRQGVYLRVPRELYSLFNDRPGALREIVNFFEALTAKVDGSSFGLSDLDPQEANNIVNAVNELARRVAGVERDSMMVNEMNELKRRIDQLERTSNRISIEELRRDIENLKRSI